MVNAKLRQRIVEIQRNEITEHHVYRRLARTAVGKNREVLEQIAEDEYRHYQEWAKFTGVEPPPRRFWIGMYVLTAKLLGLTFALKLMEKGERSAEAAYNEIAREIPEARALIEDENRHELLLLDLLDEERLKYMGSIVLGLSDALVELAGALAGLTFALQATRLVALAALVTGLAASLSMAASEYLSKKSEEPTDNGQHPLKAAFYTGMAYVVTVFLLVAPYMMLTNPYVALVISLSFGVGEILLFSSFVSVTQDRPFGRTFLEMAGITLGVATLSFAIGLGARALLGVEV